MKTNINNLSFKSLKVVSSDPFIQLHVKKWTSDMLDEVLKTLSRKELLFAWGMRQTGHLDKKISFIKEAEPKNFTPQFFRELNRLWILTHASQSKLKIILKMGEDISYCYEPGALDEITFENCAKKIKAKNPVKTKVRQVLVDGLALNKVATGVQMQQVDQVCRTIAGLTTDRLQEEKDKIIDDLTSEYGEKVIASLISVQSNMRKQALDNSLFMILYSFSQLPKKNQSEYLHLYSMQQEALNKASQDSKGIVTTEWQRLYYKLVSSVERTPLLFLVKGVPDEVERISKNIIQLYKLSRLTHLSMKRVAALGTDSQEEFKEALKFFTRDVPLKLVFFDDTIFCHIFEKAKTRILEKNNDEINEIISSKIGSKRKDFTRLYLLFSTKKRAEDLRSLSERIHPEKDRTSVYRLIKRYEKEFSSSFWA